MWSFGRLFPRTIVLLISILLGAYGASVSPLVGNVRAWEPGTSRTGVMAPHRTFARALTAPAGDAMLAVITLTATPLRAAPPDTVTFTTTILNGGVTRGPFRASLQLLPEHRGQVRSLSQSGFMLRHDQYLSLYWEWRAGASLPPGSYKMCIRLGTTAEPQRVVANYTASQRLTILSR
jgi:hypothetical protein